MSGLDRMGLSPFSDEMTERANQRIDQFGERVNDRNAAKGKGARIGGEILQGFGQAAPDAAAFLLPEAALAKATTFALRVSELAGISSVLFPQHYGNAYDEAKAGGLSEDGARDYALRSAINGTLLDSLLALGVAQGMGAVGKVLRKVFGQAVPKSAVSNAVEELGTTKIDVGDDFAWVGIGLGLKRKKAGVWLAGLKEVGGKKWIRIRRKVGMHRVLRRSNG